MDYRLHQCGRAKIDFLVALRQVSDGLEAVAESRAAGGGLSPPTPPQDLDELHAYIWPRLEAQAEFRMLQLIRDWQLDQHGLIAVSAFEEMRVELTPGLRSLCRGPATLEANPGLVPPEYWRGVEFHRTAGGWDGHEYMGFIHGELIHRQMVGETVAGAIFAQRRSSAALARPGAPRKILEMGCGSGPYTAALAAEFPDSELWACDLSIRQLEQALRRANECGLAWRLHQAAAEDTGLPAGQFDLVTSYAVLHECPADVSQAILHEAFRLLAPGGRLLMADVKAYSAMQPLERWKSDYWNQQRGGDPYWREHATADIARLAANAEFVDATWRGVGPENYPCVLTGHKPIAT